MNNDQKLDLLKINIDLYKKHSEWIAKGLLIYLAIIGTLFGIINKTEVYSTIIVLYFIIILACIGLIYFTFLIKIWVRKVANIILSFEEPLNCKLDHLYYPVEKISGIILYIGIIVLLAAFALLMCYIAKNNRILTC
jgi:hypothetical protein